MKKKRMANYFHQPTSFHIHHLCGYAVDCITIYQTQENITEKNLALGYKEMSERINSFLTNPTSDTALNYLRINDIPGLQEYPENLLADYARCRIRAHAYEGTPPPHPGMKRFVSDLQQDIGFIRAFVKRLHTWLQCGFMSQMENYVVAQLRKMAPQYLNSYYKIGSPARNANTQMSTHLCDLDTTLYTIINAIFEYYNQSGRNRYIPFEELIPTLVSEEILDLLF